MKTIALFHNQGTKEQNVLFETMGPAGQPAVLAPKAEPCGTEQPFPSGH